MPLVILLVVIGAVALAAAFVITAAYRTGTARAWNAVAIFAIGGIITGYGALTELLCSLGASCAGSRATGAIAAGVAVAACGVVYGHWRPGR